MLLLRGETEVQAQAQGQTGGREAGPIPVFDEKPERERAKRAAAEARPPPPAHKPVVAARMLR